MTDQRRAVPRQRAPQVVDRGRAVPRARDVGGGRRGVIDTSRPRLWRDGPDYRASRPGYRYGYNYRTGYGYYRPWRPTVRYHYVPLPGYRPPRVYGSWFYFPGFHLGVQVGYRPYGGGVWSTYYNPYGGWYDPYAYGGYGYSYNYGDFYTGFLRLKVRPRDAQVHVDGYFVGIVDDFDGLFQRVRLEEGPHTVEVRHPYYETLTIDVLIVAGEKVTYQGDLIPRP